MGGVEDGQPPSKRLRLFCTGSSSVSGGVRAEEPIAAGSLRDLMARPIQCEGEEEVIGSRGVIKKLEFVRLIASALYALGYERTGACLEEESGIPLHSASVNLLMQHVLYGKWDESASILENIGLEDETIIKAAKFLILEQKFLELLDDGKAMDALNTLRTEISPLHINTSRVHELSSCILYHSQSQNGFAHKDSLKAKLHSEVLDELQKLLPATIMVPARRLENLVEQALNLQCGACIFHNSNNWEMSLYADHHCGRDNIPSRTLQVRLHPCLSFLPNDCKAPCFTSPPSALILLDMLLFFVLGKGKNFGLAAVILDYIFWTLTLATHFVTTQISIALQVIFSTKSSG